MRHRGCSRRLLDLIAQDAAARAVEDLHGYGDVANNCEETPNMTVQR
jgi:hypothetical protein